MGLEASQRIYKAFCPNCGAEVRFLSSSSTHAVCSYCKSSLAREADVLVRLGEVADVFEDYSPLQLGTSGQYDGVGFSVIGRVQMAGEAGNWNEWRIAFDDGRAGWLSEDNGQFVLGRDALEHDAQAQFAASVPLSTTKLDSRILLSGPVRTFRVTSIVTAKVHTVQGELPKMPLLGKTFTSIEARNADGVIASADDALGAPTTLFLSHPVQLSRLALQNLRPQQAAKVRGKSWDCPNCGTNFSPKLGQSKSMACPSCLAIVNLQKDKDPNTVLAFQKQDADVDEVPTLPLGSVGLLKGVEWQLVGYQQRDGTALGGGNAFTWAEYLLYNQKQGFAFLIEGEEGWIWMRTIPQTPAFQNYGKNIRSVATYLGKTYQPELTYSATTRFVLGEFYWPVRVSQRTENIDFRYQMSHLSREKTDQEVVWSVGERLSDLTVGATFGKPDENGKKAAIASTFEAESGAFGNPDGSDSGQMNWLQVLVWTLVVLLMLWPLLQPSRSCYVDQFGQEQCVTSSGGGRVGGGSWGGGVSGGVGGMGGHK